MSIWVKRFMILALAATAAGVQAKGFKKDYKFTPEWKGFMEFSYLSGGDGTEVLPIYNRADGLFYSGIPIQVVGEWTGYPDLEPFRDEIEFGGIFKFSGGVEFPLTDDITLSGSLGYMFDEIEGDLTDGSGGRGLFTVHRITSDLMAFYNFGAHRIGLGAAIHVSPKITHEEEGPGFKLKTTYNFDSAVGGVIQYDYKVSENSSLGIRYTDIFYDITDLKVRYQASAFSDNFDIECTGGCEELVDASSVGVHFTYRF